MATIRNFSPGNIVRTRGREWIVENQTPENYLWLRSMGGSSDDLTFVDPVLELDGVESAEFPLPDPNSVGSQLSNRLLEQSIKLKLRAGAGPFRSFGSINLEPRAYQLVPLMMALRQSTIRLLIADDVGIGKTIEAALIVREMLDRGEITRFTVLCPPHLCEQWQTELLEKFNIQATIVRSSTVTSLERGLPHGESIFKNYKYTIVSLDYIKSDRRRDEFQHSCPELVIVDEAHTCSLAAGRGRHQRYTLLKGIVTDSDRHMILLTATPHSGNDEGYYNLLSLLKEEFRSLQGLDGDSRKELRNLLAQHLVQRRRGDIAEWKDSSLFPEKLTKTPEPTYKLGKKAEQLMTQVFDYAREIIAASAGQSKFKQRLSFWAALALLRCVSSSPAAAESAIKNRLGNQGNVTEDTDLIDEDAKHTVLDGDEQDLEISDLEPVELLREHQERLQSLVMLAQKLKGAADNKLKLLLTELNQLLEEGYRPVVFCRYIATAHYLKEELVKVFKKVQVESVTGELNPTEREEKVLAMHGVEKSILVATDCLSEGVNLQHQFNAVIHYDMSWNPTRHEQREGRVDRFGQPSAQVKTILLYGADNPVDLRVLEVILRKAQRIKDELGISIPMPQEGLGMSQAILQGVLFDKKTMTNPEQLKLDFGDFAKPTDLESAWESAKENAKRSNTIFAQLGLSPETVLPEFQKTLASLGNQEQVKDFVIECFVRLSCALSESEGRYSIPWDHLPLVLQERLQMTGLGNLRWIRFDNGLRAGKTATYIHRTHPLVALLADHVSEKALCGDQPDLASRAGADFCAGIPTRMVLCLVRIRCQLKYQAQRDGASQFETLRTLLAEEAIPIAIENGIAITGIACQTLLEATPQKNMPAPLKSRHVQWGLEQWNLVQAQIEKIVKERGEALLEDHRRVRDASAVKGRKGERLRYEVQTILPADLMGIYVLVPSQKMEKP